MGPYSVDTQYVLLDRIIHFHNKEFKLNQVIKKELFGKFMLGVCARVNFYTFSFKETVQ